MLEVSKFGKGRGYLCICLNGIVIHNLDIVVCFVVPLILSQFVLICRSLDVLIPHPLLFMPKISSISI